MSAHLDPNTADKLARICGMFGSDHGPERASAAAMADKLIRAYGLAWGEILRPPPPHQMKVRACIEHGDMFTDWERGFLRGISGQPELSPKQTACLGRLYAKVQP